MEHQFDPITGKPLEGADNTPPTLSNDPMTGNPLADAGNTTDSMNFDPMTGNPLTGAGSTSDSVNFDPTTNNPLTNAGNTSDSVNFDPTPGNPLTSAGNTSNSMNFDPMTGNPLTGAGNTSDPMNSDPTTGNPLTSAGNASDPMTDNRFSGTWNAPSGTDSPAMDKPINPRKKGVGSLIIALGVIAVAIIVFIGIKSGIFLGTSSKILLAVTNTLQEQPHFIKDLREAKIGDILLSEEYTISTFAQFDDYNLEMHLNSQPSEKQLTGSILSSTLDIDFIAGMTSDQVKLMLPVKDKRILTYNYREEKTGALVDLIGDEMLSEIDNTLVNLNSGKQNKDISKDIAEVFYKEYKSLEFITLAKKEFVIDGKSRNCKGYSTTVSPKHLQNIIDSIEKIYKDEYGEAFQAAGMQLNDTLDKWREVVEYMEDIDLKFYIYRNKLACISLEATDPDVQIELLFEGGNTRMQNMRCVISESDYHTELLLKGTLQGSEESFFLSMENDYDNYDICELNYDYKSGDYEVTSGEGVDAFQLAGNIKSDKKGLTLRIDEISGSRASDLSGVIAIEQGAAMQAMDGKEYDIGNASYSELQDLIEEYSDLLWGANW
jgi:hypothetical protein